MGSLAKAGSSGARMPNPTVPTKRGGGVIRSEAVTSGCDPNACSMSRETFAGLQDIAASGSPPPRVIAEAGKSGSARVMGHKDGRKGRPPGP
eukprot:4259269-Alexandrium_andersonii.AAC.1